MEERTLHDGKTKVQFLFSVIIIINIKILLKVILICIYINIKK